VDHAGPSLLSELLSQAGPFKERVFKAFPNNYLLTVTEELGFLEIKDAMEV
jgi:hypothetical protein